VSSLRRDHANLLCIVPILADVPLLGSKRKSRANIRQRRALARRMAAGWGRARLTHPLQLAPGLFRTLPASMQDVANGKWKEPEYKQCPASSRCLLNSVIIFRLLLKMTVGRGPSDNCIFLEGCGPNLYLPSSATTGRAKAVWMIHKACSYEFFHPRFGAGWK